MIDHLKTVTPENILLTVAMPIVTRFPLLMASALKIIDGFQLHHPGDLISPLVHIFGEIVSFVIAVESVDVQDLGLLLMGESNEFLIDKSVRETKSVE